MIILYHYPLCPFSRKVRLLLSEKMIGFNLQFEPFWKKRSEFLKINNIGTVPVLIDSKIILSESNSILEYLEESYLDKPTLYSKNIFDRAEARKLTFWFDMEFSREVTLILLYEKVLNNYLNVSPNSSLIRAAKSRINFYFEIITNILNSRDWLSGNHFSIADITVASHLSVIDYLGDVQWNKFNTMKEWYSCIKSRPSFRPLLDDRIFERIPPLHYSKLDF